MESRVRYPLSREIRAQQSSFLKKSNGLFELFDKLEACPQFLVPENTVVVGLDNITFGPGRYSIRLRQESDMFFKIVCYCILHFIFQKAYDCRNSQAYQRLLDYIFNHDFTLNHPSLNLTQQEIKIYFVKFLHLMESAKSKRKIVVEELNNLPQISILFITLVKQIGGYAELKFQQNAREIQRNITAAFQIKFDLLSCDLMLFGDDQYQVEMRHFDGICEFSVNYENPDVIQKIRDEFYLGESAYFRNESFSRPCIGFNAATPQDLDKRKTSSRILKKSTMKSIEWVESEDEEDARIDAETSEQSSIKQQLDTNAGNEQKRKQLFCTQDQTVIDSIDSRPFERPKILNFHQIIKQETDTASIPSELPTTVRSSTFHNRNRSLRWPIMSNLRSKLHKASLQISHIPSTLPCNLPISKSVQDIKTHRLYGEKQKEERKERRVPTFILNRMKQKGHIRQITLPQAAQKAPSGKLNTPRVTFTYQLK